MKVYIVVSTYQDEETDILGVFSTEERAEDYKNFFDNNVMMTGIRHIIPFEVDHVDEEDDGWYAFNRDYVKYHDEHDI